MNELFKRRVRRAAKDNPDLPIRFIIKVLKARMEMKGSSGKDRAIRTVIST